MEGEYVTPLSLQYREKASNIENAGPNPNQMTESLQAGLAVSETIHTGTKRREEEAKAREFEKVLAGGQETMKAVLTQAKSEGFDVSRYESIVDMYKTAPELESLYKMVFDDLGRQEVAKKGGTSTEVLKSGLGKGLNTTTEFAGGLAKQEEAQAKIDVETTRKEGVTGLQKEVFGDTTNQPIKSMKEQTKSELSKRIAELRTGVRKIQASTYVAEPESKQIALNADKEIADIEGELYRRNSEARMSLSMSGLSSKKMEQAIKVMDKTEEARVIGTHLNDLDSALKEIGIKEGIETRGKITQNIAGVGIGGQWTKKIIDDPANARLKQSMEFLHNTLRHKSFGATLTGNEATAFKELSGTGFISSPELFFASIQSINGETKEILRMQDIDPEIKKIIEGTGAVTKERTTNEDEAPPKKTKLSAKERTALLTKMSDKQLDDYNDGKIDIYGKAK